MPTPFFLSPSPTAVVWLTGWQMEEDGLRIAVGERVAWRLTSPDRRWMTRLFATRRMIDFALDTYVDAVRSNPVVSVSGVVVNVEAVTARSETMGDSIVRSVASSTDVFRARPRVGVTGFLVTLDAVSVDSDLSIQNERPSTIDRFGAVSSPSVPRNARPIFSATR
jgi:hypothetical protein